VFEVLREPLETDLKEPLAQNYFINHSPFGQNQLQLLQCYIWIKSINVHYIRKAKFLHVGIVLMLICPVVGVTTGYNRCLCRPVSQGLKVPRQVPV